MDRVSCFYVCGTRIHRPRIEIVQKTWFSANSISIGSRRPMGFRGVWASDSCSPHRDTPGKRVFGKRDFHWFPADQWGFEVFGPRIHVPHIEISLGAMVTPRT